MTYSMFFLQQNSEIPFQKLFDHFPVQILNKVIHLKICIGYFEIEHFIAEISSHHHTVSFIGNLFNDEYSAEVIAIDLNLSFVQIIVFGGTEIQVLNWPSRLRYGHSTRRFIGFAGLYRKKKTKG